jgi:hypothetical protein
VKISKKQLSVFVNEALDAIDRTSLETDLNKSDSERDMAMSIYSDVYKEKYGMRPRGKDWSGYTTEEIEEAIEELYETPSELYSSPDEASWDNPEPIKEPEFKMAGEVDPGDVDRYEDMPMSSSFHGRVRRPGRISVPSTRSKYSLKKESMDSPRLSELGEGAAFAIISQIIDDLSEDGNIVNNAFEMWMGSENQDEISLPAREEDLDAIAQSLVDDVLKDDDLHEALFMALKNMLSSAMKPV